MQESSAMTAPDVAGRDSPRPLEPDSLTWRDFGSYMFHVMLPQAFVLQVAHPVIDAGVGEHSTYKTDPWGRAQRSWAMLWPVVYARPDTAIRKGRELREYHRAIKGVDKHGNRYHALNPEAYGWVHATGFDATVRMHELLGTPPTEARRRQMFEEWRRLGLILGLREQDLPDTEAAYWDYFHDMIDNRLEMGDVASDLLSETHYLEIPPPDSRIPNPLWRLLMRGITPIARLSLIGTLPARFRTRFGLEWSRWDERKFRALMRTLRITLRLIPEQYRYIPLARQAIRDAQQHPQAYLWGYTDAGNAQPNAT